MLYFPQTRRHLSRGGDVRKSGGTPVKKFLGVFAILGAAAAALMFWRRKGDDDEFLDEELE
jgi:hypothetical protein